MDVFKILNKSEDLPSKFVDFKIRVVDRGLRLHVRHTASHISRCSRMRRTIWRRFLLKTVGAACPENCFNHRSHSQKYSVTIKD